MNSTRYFVCLTLFVGSALSATSEETKDKVPADVSAKTDFSDLPEGWLVGLDRAKAEAAATGKDLLLNFSASDWVPPSIELEERVFTRPAFIEEALKKFVLVRLDFPRKRNIQSTALQEKNLDAVAKYEVQSYPTIILADSQGRPYAWEGWKSGVTAESFLETLTEAQKKREARDTAFAAAAKAEGAAKVDYLAKALKGPSPNQILRHYKKEFYELVALDPKNVGGLEEVVYYEKSVDLRKELDALAAEQKWEEALAALDKFSKEHANTDERRQRLEYYKLNGLLQLKRFDDIMPLINRVIEMAPDSPVAKKALEVKPQLMEKIAQAMQAESREAKKAAASKDDKKESK